ncbi:MAG TPA: glycosyltransferase family 39 protein [Candidatus Bathyarchaeia archaeon]|nr:glycosyltransferase family 39 protein [Candidatus Bathyarchaeia archaeon]
MRNATRKPALAIGLLHVAAALAYHALGAAPTLPPETGQWHLLPADLLRNDLATSLYDLHAQPPLYNAWAGLFAKLFYPRHVDAMFYAQILLGGLIAVMTYALIRDWTRRPRFAFAAGICLALNPALFLYEHLGYETLTALGLTLTVFLFSRHDKTRRASMLAAAIAALALTTLVRSSYHPVLLIPIGALACIASGKDWRRTLAVTILIALVPLAWCAKNQARFGFFGSSSWAGQNLWKIASLNHEPDDLETLARDDAHGHAPVIEPRVLRARVFRLPHDYAPLGFTQKTGRTALDRDNRNNINIIAVSKMFGRNAIRLIRHDPVRYALNTIKAYRLFCQPSTRAIPHNNNPVFRAHDRLYSDLLQGAVISRVINHFTGRDPLFSFWLIAFPVIFILYARAACQQKLPIAVHAAALLILYTLAISTLAEYGENDRFKFPIEPILWPFIIFIFQDPSDPSDPSDPLHRLAAVPRPLP